jgi:transposase
MGKKKYVVKLTQKQQQKLRHLLRKGEAKARQLTRARVLLLSDYNRSKGALNDDQICDILLVSLPTIHRIRRQFATEGLDAALEEKPRSGRPKHFTGRDAAAITALACTDPPEGRAKWSMRLIADKAVELEYVSTISYQTVHNILKKTNFLRTLKNNGVSVK